jgi:quercetin dioxygenase-like cupin family protein
MGLRLLARQNKHSAGDTMTATVRFGFIGAVVLGVGVFAALAQEKSPASSANPQTDHGAATTQHTLLTPNDVKWVDAPPVFPRGAKFAVVEGDPKTAGQLVSFRVKMPDGYKIPPHFHPADEHVIVLQGTFNMGMGDKLDQNATKPLEAGSFAVMPKGQHHYAWTKGETIVQVYAVGPWGLTYVNPADDPRSTKNAKM